MADANFDPADGHSVMADANFNPLDASRFLKSASRHLKLAFIG
jgi:hypothetical protein